MKLLEESQLHTFLNSHNHWSLNQGQITRTIEFKDFRAAIAFVNQVANLAETVSHHPDIDIRYNKVSLTLVTHDAGGITQNDINLAMEIDSELEK